MQEIGSVKDSINIVINIVHINVDDCMCNMRGDDTGFLLETTVSSCCGT